MKKMLLILSITGIFAFANEPQVQVSQIPTGCVELKLTESTSIVSCPSAEFKASFTTYNDGSRNTKQSALLEKIGEAKPVIVQQLSK